MKRIAIVVSHPIQHFCPQYASIGKLDGIIVKVFFGSAMGAEKYFDPLFKKEISWGRLYLDKFDHEFVNGDHKVIPVSKELDAPELDQKLKVFCPDLVVVYGYSQAISRHAINWSNRNSVKCAYISDSEINNQRDGLFKDLLKQLYLRFYFRKIDFFLWVGNSNKAYYERSGVSQSKLVRMHFPIDIELYERSAERKNELRGQLRLQLGVVEDDFVVSVVGKFVSWKAQHHLITLAKLAEDRGMKITVILVGSGEQEIYLREAANQLTQSRIVFAGFVKPEELPAYYAASDAYIHPAEFEPHSLAISEAIYMGLPVIVSDRCGSYGQEDDVRHGLNGFVYKFGDLAGLFQAVTKLIKNRSLVEEFGSQSTRISRELQGYSHRTCWYDLIGKISNNGK